MMETTHTKVIEQAKTWQFDERIQKRLNDAKIETFFPIQLEAIPSLLSGNGSGDLCISAPTGSGKTYVYILPIIQRLIPRIICRLRALIVVPNRDLAIQVKQSFDYFCQGTQLKCGLAIGQSSFSMEQMQLVGQKGSILEKVLDSTVSLDQTISNQGGNSLVDILVATPGRLVDHIEQTPGFTLQHLQFLIVDEADRLLNQNYQDWIAKIYSDIYQFSHSNLSSTFQLPQTKRIRHCIDGNEPNAIYTPLQKVLLSATLTRNPRKLAAMGVQNPTVITVGRHLPNQEDKEINEKYPGIYTNTCTLDTIQKESEQEMNEQNHHSKKLYATPDTLKECVIECTSQEHPLMLLEILKQNENKRIMIFTSSIDATHRLTRLLQLFYFIQQTSCRICEYSSTLNQKQRSRLTKSCKEGKINILICSDALARGIDVENIEMVINYDLPTHLKTYIHRVGRTARAGRTGTCLTMLKQGQTKLFHRLLKQVEHNPIETIPVMEKHSTTLIHNYRLALMGLKKILSLEQEGEWTLFQRIPPNFSNELNEMKSKKTNKKRKIKEINNEMKNLTSEEECSLEGEK